MTPLAEDINKLPASQKAKLYCMLRDDEEVKNYMISNEILFEELTRRDEAFASGKIQLTTRQKLSLRLKNRRDTL